MTPEQQRIAIAEACGYTDIDICEVKGIDGNVSFREPVGKFHKPTNCQPWLPNYPQDLNACHEMEKVLTTEGQRMKYYAELVHVVRSDEGISPHEPHYQPKFTTHATAAQRCEAFLRTLGKWEPELVDCPYCHGTGGREDARVRDPLAKGIDPQAWVDCRDCEGSGKIEV